MDTTDHGRGLASLLAGALLLGFAAIFSKFALGGGVGPLGVGFYRMLVALPLVALMAWKDEGGSGGPAERGWALAAGVFFVVDLWFWHAAMHHTSAANATLLVGLSPLWVALASVLLLHARLRKRAWAGLAFALSGALILALAKGAHPGTGLGELLGAIASFAYAAFTRALTRARRAMGAKRALAIVVLVCVVGFALGAKATGEPFRGFTLRAWWGLVGLGLVCQVAAWYLITWGMGHLPAHAGAIGLMAQQVATVGLGWLLLGEAVRPLQGVGTLAILLGVGLSASAPPLQGRPLESR